MLTVALVLMMIAALAGGVWATIAGSVALADTAARAGIDSAAVTIPQVRAAALLLLAGLLLFGLGHALLVWLVFA